jgi:hypothetical protein
VYKSLVQADGGRGVSKQYRGMHADIGSLGLASPLQTVVLAQEAMALRGIGTSTCAQFAKMYAGDPQYAETVFFSWAQGYWSALNVNLLAQRQYRELAGSTEMQEGAMRSYCDKHPLTSYWEAASNVFGTFPMKEVKR